MKLYVVRHGETYQNIGKIMQGEMETSLDNNGIEQSLKLAEKIKNLNIDIVISSPQKRAYDTAKIIAPNHVIICDDRLRSRDHGEFQGISRDKMNIKEYWNIKKNKQYKEAESVKDFENRIISLLNDIKQEYKGKNVLLITHSGICRILYYHFNGIPEDGDLMGYESSNCSLEEYNL